MQGPFLEYLRECTGKKECDPYDYDFESSCSIDCSTGFTAWLQNPITFIQMNVVVCMLCDLRRDRSSFLHRPNRLLYYHSRLFCALCCQQDCLHGLSLMFQLWHEPL
jgi:hypothetical protein